MREYLYKCEAYHFKVYSIFSNYVVSRG